MNKHSAVLVTLGHRSWYVNSNSVELVREHAEREKVRFTSIVDARFNPQAMGFRLWGIGVLIDHLKFEGILHEQR